MKVLQAALLAGQIAIAHFTNARLGFWAPALLMPLILVYYPLRNLIWKRVYRQYGHLDTITRPGEVGQSLLHLAATLVTLIVIRAGTEAVLTGLIWLLFLLGRSCYGDVACR